jgi:hypothetical protein
LGVLFAGNIAVHVNGHSQRWRLRRDHGHHNQESAAMTLMAVPAAQVAGIDFVPQAILKTPVSYLATALHVRFAREHDDLDEYDGAAFNLNGLLFALRRYKGHPNDTVTIYLPSNFESVEEITKVLSLIIDELPVSRSDLFWQRSDSPHL